MPQIREYLKDIISHTIKFPGITHVVCSPGDGSTTASAVDTKGNSILIEAVSPEVDGITGLSCFSNLLYLKSLVDSDLTDGVVPTLEFGPDKAQEEDILRKMVFKSPRAKLEYVATDAKVAGVQIPKLKINDWPVIVEIKPEHHALFNEVSGMQKKMNSKDDDVKLVASGGELKFLFGPKNRRSELVISDSCDGELDSEILFSASKISGVLGMAAQDDGGVLRVTDKAIMMETVSDVAEFRFIVPMRTA